MTMTPMIESAWFRPASPRTDSGAAVAIIEIGGQESTVALLGLPALAIGAVQRVCILDIDDGLIMRLSENLWHLMPHGGPFVLRQLSARLLAAGLIEQRDGTLGAYPEAANTIEAQMLAALASARSPLAVPLLLHQPIAWSRAGANSDAARDLILRRLLVPPLVVALGGPNIGKSSLANALARRDVALVADVPGTTRDHVGVWLELDGLVVRWIDTPGLRDNADEIESAARTEVLAQLFKADLVLLCGDATHLPPACPVDVPGSRTKSVQLRKDLGPVSWSHDFEVSMRPFTGLQDLAAGIREHLVPMALIDQEIPWRFFP